MLFVDLFVKSVLFSCLRKHSFWTKGRCVVRHLGQLINLNCQQKREEGLLTSFLELVQLFCLELYQQFYEELRWNGI